MTTRERFDKMSLTELQEEAKAYGITNFPEEHSKCIDRLMDHLDRNGPLGEMYHLSSSQKASGEARCAGDEDASRSNAKYQGSDPGTNHPGLTDMNSPQFCIFMDHLMKQQQQMMQQQMMQQQQMTQQFITSFCNQQRYDQQQSYAEGNFVPTRSQDRYFSSQFRNPEISSASTGHAVKFLTSQIPSFGGLEDDDVELWIEKIESVAEIHGLSHVVVLSAATSKLTKTARRWFDLSSGEINRSWFCFKKAILDRFKRKVLVSVLMQKIQARRWNATTESFQDYATDKIALMRSLKLDDSDVIQWLVNGISNFAIKSVAASLHVTSLNQFLREMQHITDTCCDSPKKFQSFNAKYDKSKDSYSRSDKSKGSNSSEKNNSH